MLRKILAGKIVPKAVAQAASAATAAVKDVKRGRKSVRLLHGAQGF